LGGKTLERLTAAFMLVVCWAVATLNPSILGMIETLGGPVIAAILFLMPMYAIRRVPAMRQHAGKSPTCLSPWSAWWRFRRWSTR
jgi:serine transporter